MPITTFRGETSVEDIADNLYKKLTPDERKSAVRAILKANPKLRSLERLKVGSLINVPDISGLRPRVSRAADSIDQPDVRIAERLEDALQAFQARHQQRTEQALRDNEQQQAVFGDEVFRKLLADDPSLTKLAEQVAKATRSRGGQLEKRHEALEDAVKRMRKNLGKGVL